MQFRTEVDEDFDLLSVSVQFITGSSIDSSRVFCKRNVCATCFFHVGSTGNQLLNVEPGNSNRQQTDRSQYRETSAYIIGDDECFVTFLVGSTDYDVNPEYLNDEKFATLITEAEKYLGYPYVWGGSNPDTSFDCSGFVSYVLTNSGLVNTGRLGAQGLYNVCAPVSKANAQPGDLIFFVGTYDTPPACLTSASTLVMGS